MKKTVLFCCVFLCAGMLSAQNFIDKNYSELENLESSTVIHVSKMTFQIASSVIPENEEDERQIKDMVSAVESFDLVQVPDMTNARDQYSRALSKLESQFEELINVKETDGRFSVHINENGGIIYEIVGVGQDETEFTVFSLVGEIALEDLGTILSKIDNGKFEQLSKVSDLNISELSVFPNPVNATSDITIKLPAEMIGAEASVIDMSGAVLETFPVKSQTHEVSTKSMQPGYYVVSLQKDGVIMKKKILVLR